MSACRTIIACPEQNFRSIDTYYELMDQNIPIGIGKREAEKHTIDFQSYVPISVQACF